MENWKRNLYVIWAAELAAIAGFSVVMPFLPYYVQELGVTDLREVELWSGVLFACQAVTMIIFAPIWGALADRHGRKLMIQRATFGGAVVLTAMAFVHNVWQLALLRTIQGALTGTIPAAMTLVASSTPRDRAGYALGLLQMAIWAGASVGPLLGGVVADLWGYHAAFLVTGTLLLISGLTVWRFVHEDFTPPHREKGDPQNGLWYGLSLVMHDRGLVSLFFIRIMTRLPDLLLAPILPLFVQSLVPESTRVASLTGLISGAAAGTSALGALTLGRASDRIGYRRLLLACALVVAVLYVPQHFVTSPWQLLVLQGAVGFVISGLVTSIAALQANLSPEGCQGAVYGADSSAVAAANAIGPMVGATTAASLNLRAPFFLAAAAFGLAALMTQTLVPKPAPKPSPVVPDPGGQ
jgi:DHA1 family multidrug resistance protein-like MFS transporter